MARRSLRRARRQGAGKAGRHGASRARGVRAWDRGGRGAAQASRDGSTLRARRNGAQSSGPPGGAARPGQRFGRAREVAVRMIIVGVADCQTANDREAALVTYALGSCIGVSLYDPQTRVGGLLHYMLPDSALDREKAARNPYMFADTGIARLLERAREIGLNKSRALVCVAGGAQMLDGRGVFDIGKRNYQALRKQLWKAGLLIHSEDVGGSVSRTLRLELETGRVFLREGGGVERRLDKVA